MTVTIPVPTGAGTVVPVDSNTCAALDATQCQVFFGNSALNTTPVSATTKPAVMADGSGLHFMANGAALGSTGQLFIKYVPNGMGFVMTYTVGGAVSPVGSTATP